MQLCGYDKRSLAGATIGPQVFLKGIYPLGGPTIGGSISNSCGCFRRIPTCLAVAKMWPKATRGRINGADAGCQFVASCGALVTFNLILRINPRDILPGEQFSLRINPRDIAQLVAHRAGGPEVVSSSLTVPTKNNEIT